MTWRIKYFPRAAKAMRKLDRQVAHRVFSGLDGLADLDAPTAPCEALDGPLTGLWRLRVGDWRVIVDIRQATVVIVAVDLGHRSQIYDN